MYRVDNSTAAGSLPAPTDPGPNPDGYFTDGDPASAVPATMVEAEFLNMLQEELANVVTFFGGTLDKADRTQVRQAIQAAIAAQALGGLSDVTLTAPAAGQALTFDGAGWVNGNVTTDLTALRKELMLNSLLDAVSGDGGYRVLDGRADPLSDLTHIDAAASSGYTHDSAGAFIHNPASTESKTPDPTGVITDGIARTHVARSLQVTNGVTITHLVTSEDEAFSGKLKIVKRNSPGNYDTVVDLAISHGGTGWETFALGAPYVVPATGEYYIARYQPAINSDGQGAAETYVDGDATGAGWSGTENTNQSVCVGYIYGSGAQNMTVVTNALGAIADPAKGYWLGLIKPVDALTYGADVLVDLSKDGGLTWEALAVAKINEVTIDVAGTPTPLDVVWGEIDPFTAAGSQGVCARVRTLNTKEVQLHAYRFLAEA